MSIGAIGAGLVLLWMAWLAIQRDGWYGAVWAFPGAYVILQPLRGFIRGADRQLRVGPRKIDLTGLAKVAVYERATWGLRHAVAVLKFNDRVEEISGMFLSTKSFTRLVEWFAAPQEVLAGVWTPRRLRTERPDLLPLRPGAPRNPGAAPKR